MPNQIQDRLDLSGGLLTLIVGPPGTGKSWMAGSLAEFGPTHLIAFKPKEVDSHNYNAHGVEHDLFHDPLWSPSTERYEASGWQDFVGRMHELLRDDEVENVILDPLTDLHVLIKHEIAKKENASSIGDMRDSLGAWGDVRARWEEAANLITSLAFAPTPKNVAAVVHAKVPTEEEEEKRNVEFMGEVLPAIQGGFKTVLEGEFHLVLHTRVVSGRETKYMVEVTASSKRHNKVSIAPQLSELKVENDFASLLDAIEEAREDG